MRGFVQTIDEDQWLRWSSRTENVAVGMEYQKDDWRVVVYDGHDVRVIREGMDRGAALRAVREWMADYGAGSVDPEFDLGGGSL